jgi:cell division GTPase FtsZ
MKFGNRLKGIAEVITHHYTQNIDLRDAKTVLSNSGTAIMGSAVSKVKIELKRRSFRL